MAFYPIYLELFITNKETSSGNDIPVSNFSHTFHTETVTYSFCVSYTGAKLAVICMHDTYHE